MPPQSVPKKLLLAEDEDALARDLIVTLQEGGFVIQRVSHGEEVVARLKQEEHFDLILLDIVMPRTNGFEVLLALQRMADAPPVIVISNLAHAEDIATAKELGAEDYFIKAVHLPNIVNHVKGVLQI